MRMVDGGAPGKERVADCGFGEEECGSDPSPSSSTSSIGRDSDVSGPSSGDDGEAEVQSSYKGALDRMDDLEDSLPLPMRRGISKFYCGKSKSFTSLADVSSSAKDLAKADNRYNRKRKNLLATHMMFNRNKESSFRRSTGNIPKRPANSSRKQTCLSASRSSSGSSTSTSEESLPSRLPPMHPKGTTAHPNSANSPAHQLCFASRSFSLVDLQNASTGSPACAKD